MQQLKSLSSFIDMLSIFSAKHYKIPIVASMKFST